MRAPFSAAMAWAAVASLLLGGCSGSPGSGSSGGGGTTPPAYTAPASVALTTSDVQQVIAQAATQANADGHPAVIAVVDRVGNVLALFRMTGAPATAQITAAPNGVNMDAQGISVPAEAAAIAKAITGDYLSSSGNAFSTRTASMIVQPHFPPSPGSAGLGSGPLFGVQFSQLPCSDLSARFGAVGTAALVGPKRSPLGLAADPGGFPLYKNGVVVGGVGVMADGQYGFDANVQNIVTDTDERIALAGTVGYQAPAAITADQVYVAGTQLIYSTTAYSALASVSGASYGAVSPALGALEAFPGYAAATILAGATYGSEASGVRPATSGEFTDSTAFVLTDGAGNARYPITAGSDGGDIAQPLTAAEVKQILAQAYAVMSQTRAQIREPANSLAQVTVSVVDTRGHALGLVRSPDAPIFGIDVSLQKARTAAFFSNANAGADLLGDASADVRHYVSALRSFLNDPNALTGQYAFTDRAGGDLSRPYFPDGIDGQPNGPLSRPIAQFNPFSTGLQSALIIDALAQHLAYASGGSGGDVAQKCTSLPEVTSGHNRLQNGIQIFPGSVPIYRGSVLVGAIGVSGDGIDQDDMISFLGLNNAGVALGTLGNAPGGIRADNIVVTIGGSTVRLRYVNCPAAPFVNSSAQNVCQGL